MLPISCRSKLQCAVKMQISLNYLLLSLQPLVLVISIPHFAHLLECSLLDYIIFSSGFVKLSASLLVSWQEFLHHLSHCVKSGHWLRFQMEAVVVGGLQRNFLCGNVWWIDSSHGWIQGGPKKVSHKVFSISLPIVDKFQNFFTAAFGEKFVVKWLLNIPPHLNCVATLPREIKKCLKCSILWRSEQDFGAKFFDPSWMLNYVLF